MSSALQQLLSNNHPLFSLTISDLEKASGNDGIDTRLIADIIEKAHEIMRKLGLDPSDTTAEELYHSLGSSVRQGAAENLLVDTDYVLLELDAGVVSFNLHDVIENAHHELPFSQRILGNAQRHLRSEIIKRYSDNDRTDNTLVHELAEQAGLKPKSDEGYRTITEMSEITAPFILTIGDIVTDAFIKLREDEARIDTDEHGAQRLSMEFGSKPPYERVDIIQAVGNSANAAVAFTRLGLRAGLMAFLGDDQAGKDSLVYLASEHVDTKTISVQKGMRSNYHYALRYGADRTILIKYEEYNYTWQEPSHTPDWIYLSMISKASWQLHEDLMSYLYKYEDIKLVFQPGTFHFEWGTEKLAPIYKRTHIIFLNREEAALVTGKSVDSISILAKALHELGPKYVVITDGPKGSYASDGEKIIEMPNYPDPAPPYDRTGAGDSFAATMTAALALGKNLETALRWAPINSMSVVQKLGAQAGLLTIPELEQYLNEAPENYQSKELSI